MLGEAGCVNLIMERKTLTHINGIEIFQKTEIPRNKELLDTIKKLKKRVCIVRSYFLKQVKK